MERLIITVPDHLSKTAKEHIRSEVYRWLKGETPLLLLDGGITATVVDIELPEVSVGTHREQRAKLEAAFDKFKAENAPITVKAE